MNINGIEVKNGDLVEYEHKEAGGGFMVKKVIINEYGAIVERPFNYAKYFHLANLKFKKI